jgi:hypothetical protein
LHCKSIRSQAANWSFAPETRSIPPATCRHIDVSGYTAVFAADCDRKTSASNAEDFGEIYGGLIIANIVKIPERLRAALRVEFYVKLQLFCSVRHFRFRSSLRQAALR